MKHIKLIILLATLFNIVGQKASAYDIAVDNGDGVTIYYNFINNSTELQVTYQSVSIFGTQGYHNKKSVTIPKNVNYEGKTYSVTSIDDNAFFYCLDTEFVFLPHTINHIGNYAFAGCTKLETIQKTQSNIRYIGTDAFNLTPWLDADLSPLSLKRYPTSFLPPVLSTTTNQYYTDLLKQLPVCHPLCSYLTAKLQNITHFQLGSLHFVCFVRDLSPDIIKALKNDLRKEQRNSLLLH